MAELKPNQEAFVLEYLKDFNARRAAEVAGYAHPSQQGPRMVKNSPAIRKAIKEAMSERNERLGIDSNFVLAELIIALGIAKADVKPKLNSKTGKAIKDDDGNPVYTRDTGAIIKILELIGKHTNVAAWDNKVQVNHTRDQELVEAIEAGKKQAGWEDYTGDPPIRGYGTTSDNN